MIDREMEPVLKKLAAQYPVVTVTGPRQSGKTTLCRKVFPDMAYANLERPDTREFAQNDPIAFLNQYRSGAILDEIQRAPDLLSYIQVTVDEQGYPGHFILTGSQQFEVFSDISQSLAGRTALLKLLPFTMGELGPRRLPSSADMLILTGFYPRIYDHQLDPTKALGDYYETYVERDMRQLTAIKDLALFQKFTRLCAGRIGQILNLQSLANDTGVSHTTARSWITLLEASYILFVLPPWYRNISKRLIKSPKLYFYDVGLASYLLGLENEQHVNRHPLRGNLIENLVVMEAVKYRFNRGKQSNLCFYRDAKGNEVDLILEIGPDLFPIEIKAGATIASDYFKGLNYFKKVVPDLPWGSGLIYGGSDRQTRSDTRIYPLSATEEMLREIDN